MKNLWEISTSEFAGGKESLMRRGNVYQLANGYMGYRGTLDEFGPDESVGITLAGIFDRVGSAWREPVNAPNGGFTRVSVDGADLSVFKSKVRQHNQTLHFAHAVFERETVFASRAKTLTINSTRFLSAVVPNLGVIKFSLSCDQAAKITVRTGIDCNIWDLNGPHLVKLTADKLDSVLVVEALTNENSKHVAVAEEIDLGFGEETHEFKGNRNLRVITLRAEAGKTYTFHKYFAVVTDNDLAGRPAAHEVAIKTVRQARALGYQQNLANHQAEWARKWDRCDVKIEGDKLIYRAKLKVSFKFHGDD